MQLFVKGLKGETHTVHVDPNQRIAALEALLHDKEGVLCGEQRLVFAGRALNPENLFTDYDIRSDCTLHLTGRLLGGIIEPSLQILARKYNQDKLICRKWAPSTAALGFGWRCVIRCYARLHPRATNCRKKKCGHTSQLRPKKKLK